MKLFGARTSPDLNISPPDAHSALGAGAAILIDVREPSEWAQGHTPDTRHVPLATLPRHVADLPRDQQLLVICRSGNRSRSAAKYLREQGFDARSVAGGIAVWAAHGLPVVR
jgi:rhodanese-related sulfurtransferase